MRELLRRSDCPISSALDLLGDKWSLLVMLLEMMTWSARHDPGVVVPSALIAELDKDRASVAQTIRDLGSVEAFLASL